uniref:Uncharacterized protein n=1 Tax=Mola mola TaxID=94237 RepID=A0A3Q3XPJ0_MOLML
MLLKYGQRLPLLRHTDVPHPVIENFILTGAPHGDTPFFYPLWNYFIGVFCLLMASSMAHLLNSMSLMVREVCFFMDYSIISAYTIGSSLAYYYYIHPQAGIVVTIALFYPLLLLYCFQLNVQLFLSPLALAAGVNISKLPERLAPGYFDIWGHSYQCCTFLCILEELQIIKAELRAILLNRTLLPPPAILSHLPVLTVASTYRVMLLLQTIIISIISIIMCRDQLTKEHPNQHLKYH